MSLKMTVLLTFVVTVVTVNRVTGHGTLVDPPQRSSAWRYGYSVPPNYNDNELNCGGFANQWHTNNDGRCGVCGDPYQASTKKNEDIGGKYVTGTITGTYVSGGILPATVHITANHKGWFEFRLCALANSNTKVTAACLNQTVLPDANTGNARIMLPTLTAADGSTGGAGLYSVDLRLPAITCDNCVLQWWYNVGNSWSCEDSGCATGKGKQETFKNCADIRITGSGNGSPTGQSTTLTALTQAPTSQGPTTQAPTTQAPTTRAPTTHAPNTQAPTTHAPTTQAPITQAPPSGNTCNCGVTSLYSTVPGMQEWCCVNCAAGFCPLTHCYCW